MKKEFNDSGTPIPVCTIVTLVTLGTLGTLSTLGTPCTYFKL